MNPLAWLLSTRCFALIYFGAGVYLFITVSPQAAVAYFVLTYGFVSWANRKRARWQEMNPKPAKPKRVKAPPRRKPTPPPILLDLVPASKAPPPAPRHGDYYVDMVASLPAPLFELVRTGFREGAARADAKTR